MKKLDWVIVCGALIASIVVALLISLPKSEECVINIYVEDALYTSVPCGIERVIVIEQQGDKRNTIHVTTEGVLMESSTCENQTCVEQGMITNREWNAIVGGNWIICLPNRVSIELIGK